MAIRSGDLRPDAKVSIDQYQSTLPGRLEHTKGKEDAAQQYHGGTIMVDHASGYVFVHNQVSLNMGETLKGIEKFETFADSCGVRIRQYRAHNQPFASQAFRDHLEANNQAIDSLRIPPRQQCVFSFP